MDSISKKRHLDDESLAEVENKPKRLGRYERSKASAIRSMMNLWDFQDIYDLFPENIRPLKEMGDSAVRQLKTISLKVPLSEVRELLKTHCVDAAGNPVRFQRKHGISIVDYLSAQGIGRSVSHTIPRRLQNNNNPQMVETANLKPFSGTGEVDMAEPIQAERLAENAKTPYYGFLPAPSSKLIKTQNSISPYELEPSPDSHRRSFVRHNYSNDEQAFCTPETLEPLSSDHDAFEEEVAGARTFHNSGNIYEDDFMDTDPNNTNRYPPKPSSGNSFFHSGGNMHKDDHMSIDPNNTNRPSFHSGGNMYKDDHVNIDPSLINPKQSGLQQYTFLHSGGNMHKDDHMNRDPALINKPTNQMTNQLISIPVINQDELPDIDARGFQDMILEIPLKLKPWIQDISQSIRTNTQDFHADGTNFTGKGRPHNAFNVEEEASHKEASDEEVRITSKLGDSIADSLDTFVVAIEKLKADLDRHYRAD